jgi:ABC-type arginine transport system ATPase subunit
MKYSYESDEVPIAPEILENVVRVSIVSCLEYYDLVIARIVVCHSFEVSRKVAR